MPAFRARYASAFCARRVQLSATSSQRSLLSGRLAFWARRRHSSARSRNPCAGDTGAAIAIICCSAAGSNVCCSAAGSNVPDLLARNDGISRLILLRSDQGFRSSACRGSGGLVDLSRGFIREPSFQFRFRPLFLRQLQPSQSQRAMVGCDLRRTRHSSPSRALCR
jgi:hypothetical protein